MNFFRKIKGFFIQIRQTSLKDVSIKPGDTIACLNDDGTPYGICGAVFATQIDINRQIEFKQGLLKHETKIN